MKRFLSVGVLAVGLTTIASYSADLSDAEKGGKLFNGYLRCYTCHSLEPGVTKVGPTLAGLFGRKAGSVKGFNQYSEAMVNSGVVWDEETLSKFLKNPQKFIPGNKMIEGGYRVVGQVSSDQYRSDLIAYLKKTTTQ